MDLLGAETDRDIDTEIDTSWIEEFEKSEKEFASFYKEPVDVIKLYFFYVNYSGELENIHEDSLFIEDGVVEHERIMKIIKKTTRKNEVTYKLSSLLKYNFSLDPEDVTSFVTDKFDKNYLSSLHVITDIVFQNTITLFQDLNSLIFIFKEIQTEPKASPTQIQPPTQTQIQPQTQIKSNTNTNTTSSSTTKKIFILNKMRNRRTKKTT